MMLLGFCIILAIGLGILFAMMFVTTKHLNARLARNEDYLKVISEDLKQMKILLKREVAMANSDAYPVTSGHIDYKPYDETGQ